jgi:hypothetical protein
MANSKTIILVLVAFTGIVFVLDIDFARWFTCTGPIVSGQLFQHLATGESGKNGRGL